MTGVSLHDIAPRLAVARDQRRREIAVIDGLGFDVGDEWSQILRAEHETGRCPCGGVEDRHTITDRLIVGVNKGDIRTTWSSNCRRCGAGRQSTGGRFWR